MLNPHINRKNKITFSDTIQISIDNLKSVFENRRKDKSLTNFLTSMEISGVTSVKLSMI